MPVYQAVAYKYSGPRLRGLLLRKCHPPECSMPFVNVRITRDGVTREQKAQVISEITETLRRVLGKDPHLTHIVIEEVDTDNWGYAGMTTTEYRSKPKE
jgi:4-oxalocrotonate tautomerase